MKAISIEKKTPDSLTRVLVYVDATNYSSWHFGWIRSGVWEVLDEKGNHAVFITHWMAIPQSPK